MGVCAVRHHLEFVIHFPDPTHTVHTTDSGAAAAGGGGGELPAMYRPDPLRWDVVTRLKIAGRMHARHVHDRARTGSTSAALARHAVLFCYHTLHNPHAASRISLAGRLFTHDDIDAITGGHHDLPTVLRTLHARGIEFLRAGRLDPCQHLATHLDPELRTHHHTGHGTEGRARFLGVATSTLHTPDASKAVHPRAAPQAGWTALARLVDGTALTLGTPDLASTTTPLDVESTHTLARTDNDSLFAHQPWRWAHTRHQPLALQDDPDRNGARPTLDLLHDLIVNPAGHRDISQRDVSQRDVPGSAVPHQRLVPLPRHATHV